MKRKQQLDEEERTTRTTDASSLEKRYSTSSQTRWFARRDSASVDPSAEKAAAVAMAVAVLLVR